MKSFYYIYSLFLLCSCSVLVGQVKPLEEKSVNTSTSQSQFSPAGWLRLDENGSREVKTGLPDVAWQSQKTAAVISLNSVCRKTSGGERDLKKVTQTLLSQWDNLRILSEKPLVFKSFPGQETTASGRYLGRDRKFQVLVVKSPTCIYDLVYLSPIETFELELSVFQQFRDSLELK